MHGYSKWSYRPYIPYMHYFEKKDNPYICRLAPGECRLDVEWVSHCGYDGATLFYTEFTELDDENFVSRELNEKFFTIDSLRDETDYIFYIVDKNGRESDKRLFRTGFIPGTVVNYLHPEDTAYSFSGSFLCSPSIVRLPSGKLLASMDVYAGGAPQNLTIIFESPDDGATWKYVTELYPCFWGKLFVHKKMLYCLGVSDEYGDLLIGRSYDDGKTWNTPRVIMRGSSDCDEPGFHRAPCIITRHNGRLYTSVEYGSWRRLEFRNIVISVDENDDILQPESWTLSEPFQPRNGNMRAIEGNVTVSPDGKIVNMLRYRKNFALLLEYNEKDNRLENGKEVEFPGAHTKFELLKKNGKYYAIANRLPERNILSVFESDDLEGWAFVRDILNYEDMSEKQVGFQYPSAFFEGDACYILSRTAFNKADSFHNSNCITFHKEII